jgi:hypothetical protein
MSVIMGLRLSAERSRFEEMVKNNSERMVTVAERCKEYGAIHHSFYASEAGDEILVVDEWPDAESFQQLFSSSPEIPGFMAEAGVTSEPQPVFWHELDTPEKF